MSKQKEAPNNNHRFNLFLFLESVGRDSRVALRSLRHAPGFTFMVIVSLGLGIGASTAMFGVIDGLVLRPVAVPHASELVTVDTAASHVTKFGDSSYLDY